MAVNYQQMLSTAQKNYGDILAGYDRALQMQQGGQQQVLGGYNQLSSQVLRGLAGSGKHRSQEIADFYTQRVGSATQDLVNRGLGNSTVASSVGRGLAYDQAKAQTQLANLLAGQTADYRARIGLAGLGYQGDAVGRNTALMGQRLGYQSDWQRALMGYGMQGAALDQNSYGYRGGGGAHYVGGGAQGTQYAPGFRGRLSGSPEDDPTIDLNEGMDAYYQGNANPYSQVQASYMPTYRSAPVQVPAQFDNDQYWADQFFGAVGVEGY